MFETAADYHELNAGAHRNPPRILTAPLLVRHLAFWTNPDPQDPGETTKTPEQIKAAVDNYILALCQGLDPTKASDRNKVPGETKTADATQAPPPDETGSAESSKAAVVSGLQLHPNISEILLLFDTKCDASSYSPTTKRLNQRQQDIFSSTSRAVWVQFLWKRLDVMIRFEVHTEYFSMSIFVELDKDPKKTLAAGGSYSDLDELNRQIEITLEFFDQRNTLEKRQRRDKATREDDVRTAGRINKYFFHTFWDNTFSKAILDKASAEATPDKIPDAASTKATEAKFFQRIFGDFRGLILSEQVVEFDQYGKEIQRARKFTWGEDAKASFLPLIQHPEREGRYECTVNYLLDGRAFYMSTLGPQTPSLAPEQRIPVEFILYANQRFPKRTRVAVDPPPPDNSKSIVNQWQLGRLVSQFLLLGTLRLCALKDVKLLREASQELSALDESTEEARKAIAAKEAAEKKKRDQNRRKRTARKNAGSGSSESEAGASGAAESGTEAGAGTDSSDIDAEVMDRIAQAHDELNGINRRFLEKTGKGLLYRVERSRYYVQQFDDNVKLLRIKRVEGDQPYDQLIKRRLGSEFDFINRLGIRYERARGTIVTLDQNYLAITQNALVEQANQIDKDIHKIQEWGEFALLAALVPYYVVHLLELFIGETYVPAMTVGVWSICGGIAVFQKFGRYLHSIILGAVIAIIVLLVASVRDSEYFQSLHILRDHEGQREQLDTQKKILESGKQLENLAKEETTLLKQLLLELQKVPPGLKDSNPPKPAESLPKPDDLSSTPADSPPKP
jgi:hypothetical protein